MATTAEYGLGDFPYPRGWFMVAASEDVTHKPRPIHFFGQEMVVYRGKASGRIVLLDAYCPHMGTHLGHNTTSYVVKDDIHVDGDGIRCPYHGWRFNAQGQCDDIPYSKRAIPKAACVKAHKAVEHAGIIWMWHDMEGGEPDYELPDFAEYNQTDEGWVRWRMESLGTLQVHPQEIVDNMVDIGHFAPVHGSGKTDYFENEWADHIMYQRMGAGHRVLVDGANVMETDTKYHGPGILMSKLFARYPTVMLICHTPIRDGEVQVWYGQMTKVSDKEADKDELAICQGFVEDGKIAFSQDFEVWANKRPSINILQIPDDGPFHKGRIWYKQFYNSRAKAKEIQQRINGIHRLEDHPTMEYVLG